MFSHKQRYIFFILFSIISFYCLFKLLFSSELLKAISLYQIQSYFNMHNLPLSIDVKKISYTGLSSVKVKDIHLINYTALQQPLVIDNIAIHFALLPLIIGKININTDIVISGSAANLFVSISLFKLMKSQIKTHELAVNFSNFPISDIAAQLLTIVKLSDDKQIAMIKAIIADTKISGFLNGSLYYTSNNNKLSHINLQLNNGIVDLNNESLNIARQKFTQAQIVAQYFNSKLSINQDTGFKSQDFSFSINGSINNIAKINQVIDLKSSVSLAGGLEKNFAFLLANALGVFNCQTIQSFSSIVKINLIKHSFFSWQCSIK